MSSSLHVPQLRRGWMLTLYPGAGEAGGCFVSARRRETRPTGGPAADPQRAAAEAGRRARARLRRYCAANRLNRMGTLTYGPPRCSDAKELRGHIGLFFRQLREETGGKAFPYAWVPELHGDGEHFHVHFAVGRYIPRAKIVAAWGRGFVHIKLLGHLPVGSGPVAEARVAAGYLSKYVAKTFTDGQATHSTTQGDASLRRGSGVHPRRDPPAWGYRRCRDRGSLGADGRGAGGVLVIVGGAGMAGAAGRLGSVGGLRWVRRVHRVSRRPRSGRGWKRPARHRGSRWWSPIPRRWPGSRYW